MSVHLKLLNGTACATKVTRSADLLRLDQEASVYFSPVAHSWRLQNIRAATSEFWRIDATSSEGDSQLLWVLTIDVEEGENYILREVVRVDWDGFGRNRAALLDFLGRRECLPECWDTRLTLARQAISADLIQSVGQGLCTHYEVRLNGTSWSVTVAAGQLAAVVRPGIHNQGYLSGWPVNCWLLQRPSIKPLAVLSWDAHLVNDDDDESIQPDMLDLVASHEMSLAARVALREACASNMPFMAECAEAFGSEREVFLEEWFGIVPQPWRPGPNPGRQLPYRRKGL